MNYDLSVLAREFMNNLMVFVPNLIVAIIIFLVMLYLAAVGAKTIKRLCDRRQVDAELSLLFSHSTRWLLIILGTIWALNQVSFNVTGFVAGLGIAGFTIGFALKNIAENFMSGILLLLQQPFNIGEAIQVAGYSGTVTDIHLRATIIRTWEGLHVTIPNAEVYTNAITNFTKPAQRRIGLDVGVGYETNLQRANEIMLEVVSALPGVVLDDPAPLVVFKEFGDSSINCTLYFWFDTQAAGYFQTLDAAVKGVKTAFEREGINIPFPIRTVYLNQ